MTIIFDISGNKSKEIEIPQVFKNQLRTDLIRKAVTISRANKRQPYGPNLKSGMKHAVSTWGKGRGVARVQRLTGARTGAQSPGTVGGRRAHPPKIEKIWKKKLNKKEKKKATLSALSATTNKMIVKKRGHKFDKKLELPIILEDSFEEIKEIKKVIEILQKLGVYEDVLRARDGRHIRAGKGKMRGRKYKTPKSLLIVCNKRGIEKGANNLVGVDIVEPKEINAEILAPGGDPGRLTLYTESAIKEMEAWK